MAKKTELEKMMEKIELLLRLAANTTQEESIAALAKAQKIALQYNIDLAELNEKAKQPRKVEFTETTWEFTDSSFVINPKRVLLNTIALNNFCKLLLTNHPWQVLIFGEPHNIKITEYLYTTIYRQLKDVVDHHNGAGVKNWNSWQKGFWDGAAYEIGLRLSAMRRDYQKAAPLSTAIISAKDIEVYNAWRYLHPFTTTSGSSTGGESSGYHTGREAAKHVDITTAVDSPAPTGYLTLKG